MLTSVSATTVTDGGASARGSPCALLHPPRNSMAGMKITRRPISSALLFMSRFTLRQRPSSLGEGGLRSSVGTMCTVRDPRLSFNAIEPALELDHDGESQAALILPQVWAKPASRNTRETRGRGQERPRYEGSTPH